MVFLSEHIVMKKSLLPVVLMLLAGLHTYAQQMITGYVRDAESGEAIFGANVRTSDNKYFTASNIDGYYQLKVPDGAYVVTASFIGYKALNAKTTVAGKNVKLDFQLKSNTLNEVEIAADVAIDRTTPVAFSNIGELKLKEESSVRDMTMMINATPGAYATEQGGGSGDSRVNLRGFDQRNIAVMVDGVPVNDMENGWVYWSNWDGLGEVTRNMQVQRGLGASKLALPSVGGTINIITRGIDQKQGFVIKKDVGSNYHDRTSISFNSGLIGKGWGITVAGSRKTGNGWADQCWTDAWSYFFKVQKRFDKHTFTFGANGAPQSHGQRTDYLPIGIYSEAYAKKLGIDVDSLYGSNNGYTTLTQRERGLQYNPHWGYLNTGNGTGTINERVNFYHKPQLNLQHFWNAGEKFYLSTVAYASFGTGGGARLNSGINRDTTDGQLMYTSSYNTNTTFIDGLYSTTETKATRYLQASMNNHSWYGVLSTASWTPIRHLSFLFGLDARYYKGEHYRAVYNLLGGDYMINSSDQNQPFGIGNLAYSMKRQNDKISYYNDGYVRWGGAFWQTEYKSELWSAFLTVTGSQTGYRRVDYFRNKDLVLADTTLVQAVGYGDTVVYNGVTYTNTSPEARYAETREALIPGFTVKGGFNYNLTEHQNVFINAGYMNMAPRFNNVFDNNNREFLEIKNQFVKAIEVGYGYRHKKVALNVNAYYTNWENKPPDFAPTVNIAGDIFSYNVNGMNSLHKGIELDFSWRPYNNVLVEGLASIGDWTYQSKQKVFIYDQNELLVDSVDFSAVGVHVGDAAQTQLGLTVRYEPIKDFYLKARYTFFSRYYADFDPLSLVVTYNSQGDTLSNNQDRESWQLPAYGLLDFFTGYEFKTASVGGRELRCGINATVSNVLNTVYVSDAQNGAFFDASSALVYMGMGRRFTVGVRFSF